MVICVYIIISFASMNGQYGKSGTDTSPDFFCGTIDTYTQGDQKRIAATTEFIRREFDYRNGGMQFKVHCEACLQSTKK